MKIDFPKGLYSDVRVERVFKTGISFILGNLEECKEREYSAAFLRVFDGKLWYYASVTDLAAVQEELNKLARLASPDKDILSNPAVAKMSREKGKKIVFEKNKVSDIGLKEKATFLDGTAESLKDAKYLKFYQRVYQDTYSVKEFYNSLGAAASWDYQTCGFLVVMSMAEGDKAFDGSYQKSDTDFNKLKGYEKDLKKEIEESEDFLLNSVPVEKGEYTVILSPMVTGVFTHECFGHKSEADGMVGDEANKKEWVIGKNVAFRGLTIKDGGLLSGSGYIPYDDEGNPARDNYLIKNGKLTGRLHNAVTAAEFNEPATGNARAVDYTFEPIVRMTHTYIDKGDKTFEQLVRETDNGILVKTISHGSGLTTFTLAPKRAYYIKNGKIDKPVRVSVITGNVFEALQNADGISDTVEHFSFVGGGCGKFSQYPLPVGFGGPYLRVRGMRVQ